MPNYLSKIKPNGANGNEYLFKDEEARLDIASTQTASGNPLTLTDCAPINAESIVVELEPKQDLHGYDFPWVGGEGDNILEVTASSKTESGVTWTVDDDGVISVSGTASGYTGLIVGRAFVNYSMGNVIVSGVSRAANIAWSYIRIYDVNESIIADIPIQNSFGDVVVDLSQYSNAYKLVVAVKRNNNSATNGTLYLQVNKGTTVKPWTPYANICPITGYDECEVDDVGKNLFGGLLLGKKIRDAGGTLDETNKTVTFTHGDASVNILEDVTLKENTRYTLILTYKNSGINNCLRIRYKGGSTLYSVNLNDSSNQKTTIVYTTISNESVEDLLLSWYVENSTELYYEESGIFEGVLTVSDFVPYQSTSATIQFGQTVYGGVSDFVEGGTDDAMDIIDLGDLSWTRSTSYTNPFFYASISGRKTGGTYDYNPVSSAYKFDSVRKTPDTFGNTGENGSFAFQMSNTQVFVRNDAYTDAATFKTAMTGQKICFEKATVSTISTPPTPLKMLKGTNNLSADGVMQIGYQPDNVIGEVKGEIEQHLEMPWLQVIIEGEQDDFDEILLEDGGNIIQFPLADNEIYKHRFLLIEIYTTLLGLPMSLCGNAMLSTQTLIEFEHGAYIPLSIGNLTDGITARVYVSITSDNEIQVQLESTASSPLTNIYIRARLVD